MDWRVLGNSLTLYKQALRWPPTDVILLVSMVIINLKVHETPQAGFACAFGQMDSITDRWNAPGETFMSMMMVTW